MNRTILIVDDSETSRMIIRKCFTMTGDEDATFLEAQDGIHALSALGSQAIDLVVTDLNMPRMDGITLLRKLRKGERTQDLPVVVISSMGNDHLDQELKDLRVTAIIRKPLTPVKVREALGPGMDEGGF
ncbi:MAG TPA: response regulator [Spirochaetia bacterium]|jgi:CheY-like chemotaxis protein|nr:response regulator [Spirochaetia bacterium]